MIAANDFAHTVRIRLAPAYVARIDDKTQIAQTVFDGAESAVTAAIKVDFACAVRDTCVSMMRFESNQLALLRAHGAAFFRHAGQDSRATSGVNRNPGITGLEYEFSDHSRPCGLKCKLLTEVFPDLDPTSAALATALVHLRATQPQRDSALAEPVTGNGNAGAGL